MCQHRSRSFEPKKHCFTFHLDYDRLSELSDTVGYWYVEQLDDGELPGP